MKKQEIIFWLIKVILDFFIVFFSFFIARKLRLISDFIPWIDLQIQTIDTNNLLLYSLLAWIIVVVFFSAHWLYSIKIVNSKLKEFLNIFIYSFYAFLFFSVLVYLGIDFIFERELPRLIIFFALFLSIFWMLFVRFILNNIWYFLIQKKILNKNNLVIINNKKEHMIKEILDDIKKANVYNLVWYSNSSFVEKINIKYINLDSLKKEISNRNLNEIIYIDSDFTKKELYEIWEFTRIFWVRYRYLTNSFDITKTNTELSLINDIPVLELKNTMLSWWNIMFKRLFDIFLSLLFICIFFPFFLIIAIFIKIEDPSGPIIFKNKRIWRDGKDFDLYKFRYMKWEFCIKDSYNLPDTEKKKALDYEMSLIEKKSMRKWPLYKIKNDPRKTKVGNFIEKYSIDELPQLFNVLIWNMSLIGPRPHQAREVKNYKQIHNRLFTIKPWITWMAQVNGREENDFEKEADLDIFYIENWSFLLDLKILFKTISSVLSRIKK